MTAPDTQTRNAIHRALTLIGHTPTGYDIDAFYGTLQDAGIHILTTDGMERAMFDDRCDYECPTCHPEDQP